VGSVNDRARETRRRRGKIRLEIRKPVEGVIAFGLQSMWTGLLGFECTFFLLGELLIDTGFPHARNVVVNALKGRKIRAILLTHHHEDHAGNAGTLSQLHSCPIFLHRPEMRWTEGVADLRRYRRLYWGIQEEYEAEEMPANFEHQHGVLRTIPTPGHSISHSCFFDSTSEALFSGDLIVAPGASAVMDRENPCELARSLRRVADLKPRRLLSGHGLDLPFPSASLIRKAELIEKMAQKACELSSRGVGTRAAAWKLFSRGRFKDLVFEIGTGGEFSRGNFVRAALKCQSIASAKQGEK